MSISAIRFLLFSTYIYDVNLPNIASSKKKNKKKNDSFKRLGGLVSFFPQNTLPFRKNSVSLQQKLPEVEYETWYQDNAHGCRCSSDEL
jgi:hypothetical protein